MDAENRKPRVVTFLSGKGGSGKTTVAISSVKLLSEMGLSCLLVDFDLATNGASYFFNTRFDKNSRGISEVLSDSRIPTFSSISKLPIVISENFLFVSSRTALKKRTVSYDSFKYKAENLRGQVLNPLLEWAATMKIQYVILDVQAGYSIPSEAASLVSDMVVIVTEADAISSDAADNLLIQMGSSLPPERRYLVNKIDVRDADTYRNMRNVFQSLNRLPPLPFDFAVRNAFGARQIPVDIKSPSPLLFALFETLKFAFPEIFEIIEKYRTSHVDALFEEYDNELKVLLEKKRSLEEKQIALKTNELRSRYTLLSRISTAVGVSFVLFVTSYLLKFSGDVETARWINLIDQGTPVILATFGFLTAIIIVYWSRRRFETKLRDEKEELSLSKNLDSINQELDRYRSLLWAQSKDYLLDAEIAGSLKPKHESADFSTSDRSEKVSGFSKIKEWFDEL